RACAAPAPMAAHGPITRTLDSAAASPSTHRPAATRLCAPGGVMARSGTSCTWSGPLARRPPTVEAPRCDTMTGSGDSAVGPRTLVILDRAGALGEPPRVGLPTPC